MDWQEGFDDLELLGSGPGGDAWRAVERSSGRTVVLRPLPAATGLEVRRRADLLRRLRSEHLLPIRWVSDQLLVLHHADGGSLADLVARRGPLSAGEVVTVVAPLALALAELHAAGLEHGRIGPAEVLLTAEGKPLLDGLALSFLREPAAADVPALAELAGQLLGGLPRPEAMTLALSRAAADGPARELADALLGCCRAEPLEGLSRPDPPVLLALPPAAAPTSPGRRRRPALVAAAVLVVTAGVSARALLGPGSAASPAPAPAASYPAPSAVAAPAPSAVAAPAQSATASSRPAVADPTPAAAADWGAVLDRLDQARAAAFAAADPLALAQVYAGQQAETGDRLLLGRLAAAHLVGRGLRHEVRSLRPVSVGPLRVVLEVVERLSGFDLVGPAGQVQHRPPGPALRWRVVLRRTPGGWRVESIET